MTIRLPLAPLIAAGLVLQIAAAAAQGAFPAPLPGQAAPAGASPFPPVNGAPTANVGTAPSAFPSQGAAPVGGAGGFGAPPPQQAGPPGGDDCMKGFLPLRQEAERRGNLIKAASGRKAPPDEACKLIENFSAVEVKMIKYIETNAQKCGIPASVAEQMRSGHKNTAKMETQVCTVARQGGPRGPAAPSLSDALGSSAALPDATPTKRGGSTFDTLSGNVLAR